MLLSSTSRWKRLPRTMPMEYRTMRAPYGRFMYVLESPRKHTLDMMWKPERVMSKRAKPDSEM